ncbi:isoprenylcysteine carboxylmethyltransferase family protein [Mycolicibacterium sp. S2-37]|uniref:methyltransferase family protein n=1 Tax=Mycolicibacterium sp. S2-37 TaxID=2810297 RepID=UPI001A93D880|nr:isoprenylcysteine carboxylmethyltransferase family protein [Mycolicibacterium sp. S2-37]MBO0679610.1 isoprenylcysteine carboxylmethyltransferase family protein [Mycolicibacterium sp. S2-37]
MKLLLQTLASAVVGLLFFGMLLFVPAGTLAYPQAWAFIAVFLVVSIVPSLYLAVRDPAALRRRMKAGPRAETRPVQKFLMVGTVVAVAAMLIVSALDHRFGWSAVPVPVVVAGQVLVAAGLLATQLVIIQNRFAAATITIEEGQQLVSTGLYGLVRHPMYAGALIMMVGIPPALDSCWGLLLVAAAVPLLGWRIVDEERLLSEQLPGYRDYTRTVRFRLVPGIW